MEPIPEVEAVSAQLAGLMEGEDLLESLRTVSEIAQRVVPSCVGVSITMLVDGEPFTVTATSETMRELDAAQYLSGGPCLDAARSESPVSVLDVLDEQRWQDFAQATAAAGIRSSLSVPLRLADWTVIGALNLYASEREAFRDDDDVVVELFGQPVPGSVTNADLSFLTRERARGLPQQLDDKSKLDQAVGVLMQRQGWTADEARERLLSAAVRAGIPATAAADLVLSLSL